MSAVAFFHMFCQTPQNCCGPYSKPQHCHACTTKALTVRVEVKEGQGPFCLIKRVPPEHQATGRYKKMTSKGPSCQIPENFPLQRLHLKSSYCTLRFIATLVVPLSPMSLKESKMSLTWVEYESITPHLHLRDSCLHLEKLHGTLGFDAATY